MLSATGCKTFGHTSLPALPYASSVVEQPALSKQRGEVSGIIPRRTDLRGVTKSFSTGGVDSFATKPTDCAVRRDWEIR